MTQIHEPPELDCSPGAKMLIERMQTNPEDFNYNGKLRGAYDGAMMSSRDKKALNDAHDRYIKEPQLMVSVLEALTAQPEKDEAIYKPYAALIKGEGQAISASWNDPTTYSTVVNNQRIPQEMEMARIIAEQEYHAKRHIEARNRQLPSPHLRAHL